ncbi:hypothetical protein DFH11DRAFT_1545675 [Phellopilus nigrolimitatus]|nr:hypothetical protein DFH11DRAFT_1545675 [Phellopilus nigrolimitatus]
MFASSPDYEHKRRSSPDLGLIFKQDTFVRMLARGGQTRIPSVKQTYPLTALLQHPVAEDPAPVASLGDASAILSLRGTSWARLRVSARLRTRSELLNSNRAHSVDINTISDGASCPRRPSPFQSTTTQFALVANAACSALSCWWYHSSIQAWPLCVSLASPDVLFKLGLPKAAHVRWPYENSVKRPPTSPDICVRSIAKAIALIDLVSYTDRQTLVHAFRRAFPIPRFKPPPPPSPRAQG